MDKLQNVYIWQIPARKPSSFGDLLVAFLEPCSAARMHPEDPGSWRPFSYLVRVFDGKLRLPFELVSNMPLRKLDLLPTQRHQGQQVLS